MFQLKIADLNILVKSESTHLREYCRDYIVPIGTADFEIAPCEKDFRTLAEHLRELGIASSQDQENTVIYRMIAERLLSHNCFLMHGVVIEMDGLGIAFVAKSGTGKSTHAALWKKLFGQRVTIINGDKPIIRLYGNKLFAYGSPWSGKERLQTNKSCHLQKICFLERSNKNECVRLLSSGLICEAMKHIYADNGQDIISVLKMLNAAKETTEFYSLKCNMELSAAETAYKALML